MTQKYVHLSLAERKRIAALRKQKKSIGEIARTINRSKSTVHRELKRARGDGSYEALRADAKANRLKKKPRRPFKMMVPEIDAIVKQGLENLWSPEQISGRMKRERHRLYISHQCIYQWLYRERKAGGQWYKKLRINRRKRQSLRDYGKTRIVNRVGIEKRPPSVETRRYFGDWEGDTVHGKLNTGSIATVVERKSLFTVLAKVEDLRASSLNAAIIHRFCQNPLLPKRTLTVDNGREFCHHEELTERLNIAVYFAQPHCSWQRGVNENTNGLLRQYFPKRSDFRKITPEMIAEAERSLNNRPRKKLAYRTPCEVMRSFLSVDAVPLEN